MAFFVPVAVAAWQAENGAMAGNDNLYLWIAIGTGVIGLVAALLFAPGVLGSDTGTPEMQRISERNPGRRRSLHEAAVRHHRDDRGRARHSSLYWIPPLALHRSLTPTRSSSAS